MCVHDEILVSDEIIEYAERVILPAGMHFDSERRDYLSNFTTLDLKAVPGSGKTTLLLAKLIILEQNLPLRSGRSVLVLSHTNAAVDEITNRLKKHCPKLFSYPNFIGTIQSFVNKFLAVPYFESCSKRKVVSIDAENYNKFVEYKYNHMTPKSAIASWLINQSDPLLLLQSIRLNEHNKLIRHIDGDVKKFPLKDIYGKSYKQLITFKNSIWGKGILQFDDAYYFANRYIARDDSICNILRQRFGFVFVDEMQDMSLHQYKILEIFNAPDVCFQRLGDNNQAIFSNIVYKNNVWSTRANTITLHGSHRLSKKNAQLVSRFGMDGVVINGLNTDNGDFRPVMIVFNDEEYECKVIEAFKSYLVSHPDFDNMGVDIGYKVVAWRKEQDKGFSSLSKYCPRYMQMYEKGIKQNADISSNYELVDDIYTWIGTILFDERISFGDEIVTRGNIKKIIKDAGLYKDKFKEIIYNIVDFEINEKYDEAKKECMNILELVFSGFGVEEDRFTDIKNSIFTLPSFLNDNNLETTNDEKCSKCEIKEFKPCVGTVHSVKGETHGITLFLESYYDGKLESDVLEKSISGKVSVSELLIIENECIKTLEDEITKIVNSGKVRGIKIRNEKIIKHQTQIGRIQQYSKLLYVALSRARGVVGYGISKTQFEKYFDKDEIQNEWDLVLVE